MASTDPSYSSVLFASRVAGARRIRGKERGSYEARFSGTSRLFVLIEEADQGYGNRVSVDTISRRNDKIELERDKIELELAGKVEEF